MGHVSDYVKLVESLIRLDRRSEAARELRKILDLTLPRELIGEVARLTRQAGLPSQGIRLLFPVVEQKDSSPAEVAEYAACLTAIGATTEARSLLKGLDSEVVPDSILFTAIALSHEWSHNEAKKLFESYLSRKDLDTWHRWEAEFALIETLIGDLDLAGALKRLEPALKGEELESYPFLRHRAEALQRKASVYQKVLDSPKAPAPLDALAQVKSDAEAVQDWETIRECDLVKAKATQKQADLIHLLFGSPWAGFRSVLGTYAGGAGQVPDEYFWRPKAAGPDAPLVDLLTGRKTQNGGRLKIGQVLHRLLAALVSDFYAPLPIAFLHARLYPEDTYSPTASPARLHEAVKRLRLWFRENELPLSVEETGGGYRLVTVQPCQIRVPHPDRSRERAPILIERLQESCGPGPFSVRDAGAALGVSTRSALRILSEAQKQGLIRRIGQSRAIRYEFPES